MSRFRQRGRAQQSARCIVTCRIPGIDIYLNAICAFGILLKAGVLQCVQLSILQYCFMMIGVVLGSAMQIPDARAHCKS